MKRVALVIPVFNVENYLQECLDSILSQTYKNFVAFIINDGSTDHSEDILNEYKNKDHRLYVVHQKNEGVSSARNKALSLIEKDNEFDYVCFIDSDDLIQPTFVETFVEKLSNSNSQYGVCGRVNFDRKGIHKKIISGVSRLIDSDSIAEHYFKKRSCSHGFEDPTVGLGLVSKFFSYSLIKSLRFDTSLKAAEDIDYMLSIIPKIHKGILIPDVLYLRRLRKSSTTNSTNVYQYDWIVAKKAYSHSSNFSPKLKLGLENFLVRTWWNSVRFTYQNLDQEQAFNDIKDAYHEIKSMNLKKNFSNIRKFMMFSLGKSFLRAYFSHIRSKKTKEKIHYFD